MTCDGAGACRPDCSGDGQCEGATYCTALAAGECKPRKADGAACGPDPVDGTGAHQCSSGFCLMGSCGLPPCAIDADCAAGYYCKGGTLKCTPCTAATDDDGDGSPAARCGGLDCDDHDPTTKPGAADPADIMLAGVIETIEGMASPPSSSYEPNISFAIDASGLLGVAFQDDKNLRFLRRTAAGWSAVETIDGSGATEGSPALAFDGSGASHVLYHHSGRLSYAHDAAGAWSARADVSDKGGLSCQAVMDGSGVLHAVDYWTGLRYFRKPAGGAWTGPEIVDTSVETVFGPPSVAVEPSGIVHVCYRRIAGGGNALSHAVRTPAGAWSREDVETVSAGGYCSLALDASGALHLSYAYTDYGTSPTSYQVRYAAKAAGAWTRVVLDGETGWNGGHTSIVSDARGRHVAYFRGPEGKLVYATDLSGTWSTFAVDMAAPGAWTYRPILRVAPAGRVHIVYYKTDAQDILHAELGVANSKDGNCDGK